MPVFASDPELRGSVSRTARRQRGSRTSGRKSAILAIALSGLVPAHGWAADIPASAESQALRISPEFLRNGAGAFRFPQTILDHEPSLVAFGSRGRAVRSHALTGRAGGTMFAYLVTEGDRYQKAEIGSSSSHLVAAARRTGAWSWGASLEWATRGQKTSDSSLRSFSSGESRRYESSGFLTGDLRQLAGGASRRGERVEFDLVLSFARRNGDHRWDTQDDEASGQSGQTQDHRRRLRIDGGYNPSASIRFVGEASGGSRVIGWGEWHGLDSTLDVEETFTRISWGPWSGAHRDYTHLAGTSEESGTAWSTGAAFEVRRATGTTWIAHLLYEDVRPGWIYGLYSSWGDVRRTRSIHQQGQVGLSGRSPFYWSTEMLWGAGLAVTRKRTWRNNAGSAGVWIEPDVDFSRNGREEDREVSRTFGWGISRAVGFVDLTATVSGDLDPMSLFGEMDIRITL